MIKTLTTILTFATASYAAAQSNIYLGGDISLLPEYERVNTPYYDSEGNKTDALQYMKDELKMNSMRVRLFVNPTETGSTKTGVVQNLEYVKNLGARIRKAGLTFMLDFHYSDSWADPAVQTIPKSWYSGALSSSNPTDQTLQDSIYSYTKRCLDYLKSNGATPDFIQIGNEISYGMLWRTASDKVYSTTGINEAPWKRFAAFLKSGAKAVRKVCPEAKIVIHTERAGNSNTTKGFYDCLKSLDIDYDVIGLSYYPFFHGFLTSLSTTLNTLEESFPDKQVQIVETAYYYQYFPSKTDYNTTAKWAATVAGQESFISDLCSELAKHNNVNGLYYWFPEENGNGGATWSAANIIINDWVNRGLWDDNSHKVLPAAAKLKDFITQKQKLNIGNIQDNHTGNFGIYDLSGRRLNEEPSRGMYIRNGYKVVKF